MSASFIMFIITLSLGNWNTRAAISAQYQHEHKEILLQCFCIPAGASPNEIGSNYSTSDLNL